MYESRCKGLLKTKNVYNGRVCAVKVEHWASNVNMCHVICAEASYRFSIILCNLLFLSNYYSWCVSILTSLSVIGLLKHIASKYMNIVEIAPANVSNICSNKNCSYTRVIFSLPHRLPCFIPLFYVLTSNPLLMLHHLIMIAGITHCVYGMLCSSKTQWEISVFLSLSVSHFIHLCMLGDLSLVQSNSSLNIQNTGVKNQCL